MIQIPHGLPAQILTALTDRGWMTAGAIVDAIDAAERVGEDEPGVGFSPVVLWLIERRDKDGAIEWRLVPTGGGATCGEWRIRRG